MTYIVKEIFYTLQGEGRNAGRPAVFCRFSGCNLWTGREADRHDAVCQFCDTDFVGVGPDGGRSPTPTRSPTRCSRAGPTVTDAARRAAGRSSSAPVASRCSSSTRAAIDALHARGFEVAVETNGTQAAPAGLDHICVSPKADAPLVLTRGHELKLVYPQRSPTRSRSASPSLDFEDFFLQPLDAGDDARHPQRNTAGGARVLPRPSAVAAEPPDAQAARHPLNVARMPSRHARDVSRVTSSSQSRLGPSAERLTAPTFDLASFARAAWSRGVPATAPYAEPTAVPLSRSRCSSLPPSRSLRLVVRAASCGVRARCRRSRCRCTRRCRESTMGTAALTLPFTAPESSPAQKLRDSLVIVARAQIGTRYVFGGTTPKGFDCSGLVRYVMAALKVELPRTAAQQARIGDAVSTDPSNLRPGDLLTFGKKGRAASVTSASTSDRAATSTPAAWPVE